MVTHGRGNPEIHRYQTELMTMKGFVSINNLTGRPEGRPVWQKAARGQDPNERGGTADFFGAFPSPALKMSSATFSPSGTPPTGLPPIFRLRSGLPLESTANASNTQ